MKNRVNLTQFELAQDICFDPSPIIAGVAAVGSSVGSAAINAGAKWGSSTYLRVAKEMAQYNQAMNEAFYNKYQSPAALMAQYKEAGLNPYLVYGNAQPSGPEAGQVSTNPQDYASDKGSVAGAALASVSNAISNYQQIVSNDQALTNARKTAENIDADTRSKNLGNAYQEFKNLHQAELYDLDKRLKSQEIQQRALDYFVDAQTKYADRLSQINKRIADTEVSKETKQNLIAEREVISENKKLISQKIKNLQHDITASDRAYDFQKEQFAWHKSQAAAAAAWRKSVYDDHRADVNWSHGFQERQQRLKEYHQFKEDQKYMDEQRWRIIEYNDALQRKFESSLNQSLPLGQVGKIARYAL